ncbi:MAG TPA: diguanylate cyclase [Xanthobacteraceae bacterium]|nr:diguanylate cyclase [Xanthobacteraceae bacterium]
MPSHWRPIVGPLATFAIVTAIALFERYVAAVPNPGAIFFIAVMASAFIGGTRSGLIAAAIALGFSAIHFFARGHIWDANHDDLVRVLILFVTTPCLAIAVGLLKARTNEAMKRERQARLSVEAANRRLVAVQAALDESHVGVVVLDQELRAQFINRAFRNMWQLPDDVADRQPPFVALVYHGRNTHAYAVPDERLDEYVAERVRRVRSGDLDPLDIRLSNGEVVRLECTVLPAGGRMLTYTPVTDLVRRASVDALSGLFNRRHFLELAEGEWNRFDRYERPLSLMMLDIDLFKSVNDRYGHDVGDQAIAHLAAICRNSKRVPDIVARVGGEEFAMLLPETPLQSAALVAERLRREIAETPLVVAGAPIRLTVSIGVAEADTRMLGIVALMKEADEALYRAKRGGRNRVALAPADAGPIALAS